MDFSYKNYWIGIGVLRGSKLIHRLEFLGSRTHYPSSVYKKVTKVTKPLIKFLKSKGVLNSPSFRSKIPAGNNNIEAVRCRPTCGPLRVVKLIKICTLKRWII